MDNKNLIEDHIKKMYGEDKLEDVNCLILIRFSKLF